MFIPANATALPFDASWGDMQSTASITLRKADQTAPQSTFPWPTFTGQVAPLGAPLIAGQSYVLDASRQCSGTPETAAVPLEVREAAPFPTSLGKLKVVRSGPGQVFTTGSVLVGSCGGYVAGTNAELELTTAPDVEPWSASLSNYELVRERFPLSTPADAGTLGGTVVSTFFRNPGKFVTSALCEGVSEGDASVSDSRRPGQYRVHVRARLPTAEERFVESERIDINLVCPKDTPAGQAESSSSGPTEDAGATTESTKLEEGCNVGSTRGAQSNLVALLMTALAVLLSRARHRKTVRT